ncbi:MAG: ABC transporter ATP-binding protein [Vicinamibacterales bacterium]
MIRVENLTKRFGRHVAVDNLTFTVEPGEVLGFLGPNGAGKTTTMRMVTGYSPPTAGRITIDGLDLLRNPIAIKRRIGYLPENPPLYPELTVRRYLEFVADIKDVPREKRAGQIAQAITRANLDEVSGKRIGTLSKGFRQRVGLAQAIVHEPPVLILDEPTSSLDPKQRVEVRDLIVALRGRHTVLLSTHILPEVSQIADRVVIINRGKVMAVDTPANLSKRVQGGELVVVDVAGATPGDLRALLLQTRGVTEVSATQSNGIVTARVEADAESDVRAEIAAAVAARGWRLHGLRTEALSLEEVFLKLTQEEK